MSLNKVMLIGRLGNDPELKYTQGGQPVANFNLATNEKWQKDGKTHEKTEWHRIVVWGKMAETCEKYLKKGRQAYIEGKIQTRDWEDKDGQKRYTTEVVALSVQFLGDNNSGGGGGNKSTSTGGGDSYDQSFNDDDIPF